MLEEKLETLTKEVVALRQAIEKNGLGGAAKAKAPAADEDEAPAKSKAPAKKAPAKKKAVEPDHDADEVGAIMRKLAKEGDAEKKAVRKFIASKDCADLADLLTKPELFDETFDWATEQLGEEEPDADDDDDDV
jgi:hypothetical protein